MATKEVNTEKLHIFFKGEAFKQRHERMLAGYPLIMRTFDGEPWNMSVEEIEEVLHQYEPELSAAVDGAALVIFHETEEEE